MRKVECYLLVLEICKCPLEGGKYPPRISLFQRQVSYDLERVFESNGVITVRLNQAIEVGLVPSEVASSWASGSTLISPSGTFVASIVPSL